jgi:predicted MFS family arabinose efflux permease
VGVAAISLNGRVIDRVGTARALVWSLVLLTALMATLPWMGGVPIVLAVLIGLLGVGQGGFLTAMTTVMTQASATARGTVVALMSCTTYIGVTLGAAVMGPVFEGPGFGVIGVASAGCALAAATLFLAGHRVRSAVGASS